MGNHKTHFVEQKIGIQQNIQVQRPRPILDSAAAVAPKLLLNRQQAVQQLSRPQLRLQSHHRIQKTRLIRIPHRLR